MPNQKTDTSDGLHFPRSAPIEAYGKGGFAFADMSHRGSLLCLPDSIWAWDVTKIPVPHRSHAMFAAKTTAKARQKIPSALARNRSRSCSPRDTARPR